MDYFLGVDIGNTKSHALIADANGRSLGFGQAGCGSWEALGWDGAQAVLNDITSQAMHQAQVLPDQITGAGFGFAGYDWPEDRAGHEQLITALGLTRARYDFGNDTLVGLMAGATAGWGVVVVAGTSNNCRGWDENGREGRITGMGSAFGENGGAWEIVQQAHQAVSLAWSQRGPATGLSQALVAHAGASSVDDLLAGLARDRYHLSASAAPLVFAVAAQGDAAAQRIITWAGRELGSLAVGIIRQLALETKAFEVVLSGSLYKGNSPLLVAAMRETIHAVAPQAQLVHLNAPPVTGGVLLGMKCAGLWPPRSVVRSTLIHTANQLIKGIGDK